MCGFPLANRVAHVCVGFKKLIQPITHIQLCVHSIVELNGHVLPGHGILSFVYVGHNW